MASKGCYAIFIIVTMCFFSLAATVKPGREVSKGYVLIVGTCNEDVDCRGSCNNNDVLLAVATCLKIPFGVGKECYCLTIDEKLGLGLSYTFIRLCLRHPESTNGFNFGRSLKH